MPKKVKLLKAIKDMVKDGSLLSLAMLPAEEREEKTKEYLNSKYVKQPMIEKNLTDIFLKKPNMNSAIYTDTDSVMMKVPDCFGKFENVSKDTCKECSVYAQCAEKSGIYFGSCQGH